MKIYAVVVFAGNGNRRGERVVTFRWEKQKMKNNSYISTPTHTLPSQSRPSLFGVD